MRINLFRVFVRYILSFALVLLNACQKDDTTPPVLTMVGGSSITLSLNHRYVDPGVTAYDAKDGTLPVTTSGNLDINTKGTYVLTYSATDFSGNTSSVSRTINVVNDAEPWAATYSVYDSSSSFVNNYSQIIIADFHVNNQVDFNKFGDYSGNTKIYGTISNGDSVLTIPSQPAVGIGSNIENHTFNGSGSKVGNNISIIYTDINNSTGNSTTNWYSSYTRQ